MHWELWDTESGNLVATFSTEDEALAGVRDVISVNAPDYFDFLSLGAAFSEGEAQDYELPPVLEGEALRSRLAATVPQLQASRAMHGRIRSWLLEENWQIRNVDDPQTLFNVLVTLQNEQSINLFQRIDHVDHLTVALHVILEEQSQIGFSRLPVHIQQEIAWKIDHDVTMMGVEFENLGLAPTQMRYASFVYFDGLTKQTLIQQVLLILRAVTLSVGTIRRALEEAGHSLDASGRPIRLVHRAEDAPGSGNSLTAAS